MNPKGFGSLRFFLFLVAIAAPVFGQSKGIDMTDHATWEDAPDLKITTKQVNFRSPAQDGDLTLLPRIALDYSFKNIGNRPMDEVKFDFFVFCEDKTGTVEKETPCAKAKPMFYTEPIPSNGTGSCLYELHTDDLSSFSKVVVRVSQITYSDGSIWKYEANKP